MHKRKVVLFFCLTMYIHKVHFHYPRDVIYARVLAMALCLSVRPSLCKLICLSLSLCRKSVFLKRTDESSFLAWRLLSTSPALCYKEIQVYKNKGTSLWKLFPKLRT